ncbi:hypothetical protein RchiOBHm_Chr6g0282411 [Rosa chinensis]|uniref:Uncharacterized protein n=1 Tax=Rosa chinensis TaxID=74649 RepID=A0A2P6PTT1_ROSCH|nr:hypothetical protein RchiOBHm_Chr6g0282411 [Rosa chinensis]
MRVLAPSSPQIYARLLCFLFKFSRARFVFSSNMSALSSFNSRICLLYKLCKGFVPSAILLKLPSAVILNHVSLRGKRLIADLQVPI